MLLGLIFSIISAISAVPSKYVQNVAEYGHIENFDNYLPKVGDYPKFEYSTFTDDIDSKQVANEEAIEFKRLERKKNLTETFHQIMDYVKNRTSAGFDILEDMRHILSTLAPTKPEETTVIANMDNNTDVTTTEQPETTTLTQEEVETTTIFDRPLDENRDLIDPVFQNSSSFDNSSRPIRQESEESEESTETTEASNENQEEGSSEEEEDGNMITSLISAFLGGLSRPDGSVDVEAITGLLGSLSSQNPDGSYNFSGLTDLLMSFFGGGGEEGGGSDFGAFIGGLLGAFLEGIANPPGGRGVGAFVGNLLGTILPSLSGPPPPAEGQPPQQGLDSGGFLSGFLQSFLGSSGSLSGGGPNNGTSGDAAKGGGSKFQFFKAIFSVVTSILGASSGSSGNKQW